MDVEFLGIYNCMDYSLLVGVHWMAEDKVNKEKHDIDMSTNVDTKENGLWCMLKSGAESMLEEMSKENKSTCMQELHSTEKLREIYFIGIIDILSRYGVRKKVAHLLKSALWEDSALSTVPADYYASRYINYVRSIFPSETEAQLTNGDGEGSSTKDVSNDKEEEGKLKVELIGTSHRHARSVDATRNKNEEEKKDREMSKSVANASPNSRPKSNRKPRHIPKSERPKALARSSAQ